MELGNLDLDTGKSIAAAATEVADGSWDEEFVVDIYQTGSGTSTNMNTNEGRGSPRHRAPRGARGRSIPTTT